MKMGICIRDNARQTLPYYAPNTKMNITPKLGTLASR